MVVVVIMVFRWGQRWGQRWCGRWWWPVFKVNGAQLSHLARVIALVIDAIVAELSVAAMPPAFDGGTLEHRTGVEPASRNGNSGRAKIHGARCIAQLVVGAVVAELPVDAMPPALGAATFEEHAGMLAAGRDAGD